MQPATYLAMSAPPDEQYVNILMRVCFWPEQPVCFSPSARTAYAVPPNSLMTMVPPGAPIDRATQDNGVYADQAMAMTRNPSGASRVAAPLWTLPRYDPAYCRPGYGIMATRRRSAEFYFGRRTRPFCGGHFGHGISRRRRPLHAR